MTIENIKEMLDSFYMAKRILDLLPSLPEGVSSSYIRYLDMIEKLSKEKKGVRVSDISDALELQKPGVTRTLNEMEEKGYIAKSTSSSDLRVTYLEITDKGEKLSKKYNEDVFLPLLDSLSSITDEEVKTLVGTIEKFYSSIEREARKNERKHS